MGYNSYGLSALETVNNMEHQHFPLTVAEYFAGLGLVKMGLQPYGWQVSFANDISKKKFEMYKAFFPNAEDHYVVADILIPVSFPRPLWRLVLFLVLTFL